MIRAEKTIGRMKRYLKLTIVIAAKRRARAHTVTRVLEISVEGMRVELFWQPAGRDYPIDMADAHPPSDTVGESADSLDMALRTLPPIEEKVVRLSYGIGCQRAHSVAEIAAEFGVGAELIETSWRKPSVV